MWQCWLANYRDSAGRPWRVLGTSRDVTDQERTRQTLQRNEAELQAIYDHAPVLMCLLDAQRRVLYVNRAFTEFTQVPREDLLWGRACGVFGCINAQDSPEGCGFGNRCVDCALRRALEDTLRTGSVHRDVEYRATLVRGDQRRQVVMLGATTLLGPVGVGPQLLVLHNITERERMRESLAQTAADLNSAQQIARLGSWHWDLRQNVARWSDGMFRVLGLPAGSPVLMRDEVLQAVHPQDRARMNQALNDALLGVKPYDIEYCFLSPDGSERHIHARGEVTRDADGQPLAMHGTLQDVTERRRIDEALRQSEQRYRLLVENAGIGIGYYDTQGTLLMFNALAARMMNGVPEDLHGKTVRELYDTGLADLIMERIGVALHEDAACSYEDCVTLPVGVRWFHSSYSPVTRADGTPEGVQIISWDITELRRSEEELRNQREAMAHLSRVATLGELSSGLAHELNQPLGAILLYAETCRHLIHSAQPGLEELGHAVDRLIEQAERARKAVDRIRDYVRRRPRPRSTVDLNELVTRSEHLLMYEIRRTQVQVDRTFAPIRPLVLADSVLIEQVIVNLMLNALEVMSDTPSGQRRMTLATHVTPDGACEVAVSDTGHGVAPVLENRLFSAFATTRPQGLGLGLTICRSIIERHGGSIWHEGAAGGGATFRFRLPGTRSHEKGGAS